MRMSKPVKFLFLWLLFCPLFANAEVFFSAGFEYRPERDTEGYFQDRQLQPFSVGYLKNPYLFSLERASFSVLTGNQSLSVQREYSNVLVGLSYFPKSDSPFAPYLGFFIGQSTETLASRVENDLSVDRSRPQWMMMQAFGLSFRYKILWLSAEARLFETTMQQSRVFLGSMARIGVVF